MYNSIIGQPIAIDRDFLYSLIPTVLLGFKTQDFKSSKEIDFEYMQGIELQAQQAAINADGKFPVVISIRGPIVKYSTWYYVGTQTICQIVKSLQNDERVSGFIFNIDSGGGMVSGTGELCSVIKNCELPTLAYTNGYMCSAAYEISSACDARMAHPNADLIGSIGTMLSFQDFSALFEKYGAKIYEVYAPQSTEKNKEFRELLKGNEEAYKKRLEELTEEFIATVKENVSGLKDDGKVFKGKTYTPQQALKIGLINEIGTFEEAILNF